MAELPLRLPESDRPTGQNRGSRMVTFSLSVPKLVFSILLTAVILIWVFIFGIMLGRGHKPEKVVPELARVMPAPQGKNATSSLPATTDAYRQGVNNTLRAPAAATAAQNASKQAAATPQPSGVLTPQELMYHDTLKGRPTASPLPVTTPPKAALPAKTPGKTQAAKTDTKKQPPKGTGPKTQNPKADAKAQTPKPEAKTPAAAAKAAAQNPAGKTAEPVFNYVYQVAAFKDAPSAESLRKKLQAAGVATRIEKDNVQGTTWYKLLTSFKGRPEDTRSLRQKLNDQGISRVILRSKAPVL